ncbi:NitT/TauT family transport system permease protein [Enhydrobacter aerosaccus]|uniref:NitT/TauT family transport system permease protein n=1 Tax=Enhydrobacter aerosaccus TaxID=225324 RepID=A0A1T4QV95_9HYPH|nr:ABC transporter permease subunit [Enhydrobacter aerosaccus]SKA07228.1 NitT/TauT family transport system permease protein [Enhydrobacter aerosaccus]
MAQGDLAKVGRTPLLGLGGVGLRPNIYDLAIFILIAAAFVAMAYGAGEVTAPVARLTVAPVTLDPANLPGYALRTTLRMFAAIGASLIFTFVVATLAAKSRKAELVIVPALDILQSVPVLGFLTFTVVFFLRLFPDSELGAECAAVFAIFTSQAWNMAFSFYQSLRTVPADLDEVSRHFQLSPWLKFWRLEAPFAAPGLIWNTMMSMSGGWFFVVASEAITVGDTTVKLPGIGSWLATAIDAKDIGAVVLAVATMAVVILAYDQLLFRPIVAWADKFRFEQTAAQQRPRSWVYELWRRGHVVRRITLVTSWIGRTVSLLPIPLTQPPRRVVVAPRTGRGSDILWRLVILAVVAYALWRIVLFTEASLGWGDLLTALEMGLLTLLRVVVLISIASAIWVPVGVWIGLRPWAATRFQPLAQFLAAFPANVLFPMAVVLIVSLHLDPNIWLSPLMVLGTQWYILFNVIAGASAFPTDLREASTLFRLRTWQWWRKVILPGILPYYVTGALTASGGSWNASIVAEVASWGDTKLKAAGLGSYIADATEAADYPRVVLGIVVMSVMVVACNRLVWRPLYRLAERRFRLA